MKVKARIKGDVVEAKIRMTHKMWTYDIAKKKTGSRDNAEFITHITGTVNGNTVLDMSTSQFLSKNPIVKFKFKASVCKAGDKLEITWVDNQGHSKTKKGKIK